MTDLDSDSPAGASSPMQRLAALDAPATVPPGSGHNGSTPRPVRLTRRGRLRKWDRPKHPMDWRFWVGNVGKALIAIGLLMFGFVAYQLWGTGIETARAQNALENEFDALLAETAPITAPAPESDVADPDVAVPDVAAPVITTPPAADPQADAPVVVDEPATDGAEPADVPVTTAAAVPVEQQNLRELEEGDALARIEIPAIGVNDIVVAGVSTGDLKKGPGHFPETPLPGQLGNSAIAGHRTTYGQPFHNVDKLVPGDEIVMTTLSGTFTYRVTGTEIVSPSDYQVISTTDPNKAMLTLTSCHPKWTARQRIIIFSELVPETSAPIGEPVINYGRPIDETPDETLPAGADGDEASTPEQAEGVDVQAPLEQQSSEGGVSGNLADPAAEGNAGAEQPDEAAVNEGIADAFAEGWFSDPGANLQVGLWGLLLSLISVGAYLISRRFRRDWAGALVGIMPFVVALYFFFQNVNRLLPPNL
ncbi:MAG: class E sortase [Ilumatobacter sp.]|nr:class E sortase [Ilumatobacter sp.]